MAHARDPRPGPDLLDAVSTRTEKMVSKPVGDRVLSLSTIPKIGKNTKLVVGEFQVVWDMIQSVL